MHNVLILGGSGLLGKALINEMNKHNGFQIHATYFENPSKLNKDRSIKLDIGDLTDVSNILNTVKPQSVISCLRGDYSKQLILHTKIAEHLKETDGRLYFFSTTNVFDKDLSKPYYEDDLPNSSTEYGQYKIACEKTLTEILHDNVCILRIPQIWGKDSPRMNNLLGLLRKNEKVVVYPTLFSNTNTDIMVAKQLYYIIETNGKGVFHLCAEDVINQKDFCKELILGLGFRDSSMQENFEEGGYFALLSKRRNEFPERLRPTNKSVINYLINSVSIGL